MQHDHLWLLAWEQTYLFIFILCKIPSRQLVEHTIKPHYRFWPLLSNTKNNTLFSQASLWKQSIANTLSPQASLRKQSIRQLTPLNDNLKKYIKPKNALLFTRRLPFSFRCSPPLAQVSMCLRLAQVSMCLRIAFTFYCQAYVWFYFSQNDHALVCLVSQVSIFRPRWLTEREKLRIFYAIPWAQLPSWPVQVKSILNREETKTHIIVSRQQTKCFMQ